MDVMDPTPTHNYCCFIESVLEGSQTFEFNKGIEFNYSVIEYKISFLSTRLNAYFYLLLFNTSIDALQCDNCGCITYLTVWPALSHVSV